MAEIMYSHLPYFVRLVCGSGRFGLVEKLRRSILVRRTGKTACKGDAVSSDSRRLAGQQ